MRIVVSDTTPLNYLLLIEHIDLLPRLFEAVHIPNVVRDELSALAAPPIVRTWISSPPAWLAIKPTPSIPDFVSDLDAGEQAVIALAAKLDAALLLIDERAGVTTARAHGFKVTGTLGVLSEAAALGLIDLRQALVRLTKTSFRIQPRLIEALLARQPSRP